MAKTRKQAGKKRATPKARKRPARRRVSAIPAGAHTVTAYLAVNDAAAAVEFYKRAFGATERMRMAAPDGKIMHAAMRIGDSQVFLADEFPGADTKAPAALGTSSVGLHLYFRDVDRAFARAVGAGATVTMPLADMFWGDRFGKIRDPFGHVWSLSQHVEDVPPKEMAKRAAAAFPPPPSV
jgi:PhnB protein